MSARTSSHGRGESCCADRESAEHHHEQPDNALGAEADQYVGSLLRQYTRSLRDVSSSALKPSDREASAFSLLSRGGQTPRDFPNIIDIYVLRERL